MKCETFENQIFQPDLSTEQVERLKGHAEKCDHCQQRWQQYLLLEEATNRWLQQKWHADVIDAVMHALNPSITSPVRNNGHQISNIQPKLSITTTSQSHASDRHPLAQSAALFAVLSSLLLMLFMPGLPAGKPDPFNQVQIQKTNTQPEQTIARQAPPPPAETIIQPPVPELRTAVRDAGSAYWALATEAHSVITQARILLPDTILPEGLNQPIPLLDPQQNQNLQQQLEPLGNRVDQTIEYLIEKIPLDLYPRS